MSLIMLCCYKCPFVLSFQWRRNVYMYLAEETWC